MRTEVFHDGFTGDQEFQWEGLFEWAHLFFTVSARLPWLDD